MTDLAKLVVKLEAQTSKYMSQLDAANRRLSRFQKTQQNSLALVRKSFGALAGVVGVGFFAGYIKSTISSADAMLDLTNRIGGSVEAFSELEHVAKLSGVQFNTMTMGLQRMTRRIAEAAQGTGEAKGALKELGLEATAIAQMPLDKQFETVADALSRVEGQSDKTRLAMKLFDSEGVALLQTMERGAQGIREMRAEAQALGKTLTTEQAQAASDAADAMERLKASTSSLARDMTLKLVPAINAVATGWNALLFDASPFPFEKQIQDTIEEVEKLQKTLDRNGTWRPFIGTTKLTQEEVAETERRIKELTQTIEDLKKRQLDVMTGGSTADPAMLSEITITADTTKLDEQLAEWEKDREDRMNKLFNSYVRSYETAEQQVARKMREFDMVAHMFPPEEQERIRKAIREPLFAGLEEIEITVKKRVSKTIKDVDDEVTAFMEQASRNTQDIISRNLQDGFKDGADGILDSFHRMINALVAEALAARLAEKLFGSEGVGSGGGLIGKGIDLLSGIFGGSRDSGGRGYPGHAYLIGTGAQPEMFVPDRPGTFVPAGAMGGQTVVNQNISTQGRIDRYTARQLELQAYRRQRVAQARLG